jgi:ribonuclease BN (tRNA processing enzyme)
MEIVILGSGTALPVKDHSPAGIMIKHEGHHILLDIGPGTLTRLLQVGITFDQLDFLLSTHLHPDHTLDLATLLQIFDSAPDSRRTLPFSIIGCKGTKDFIDRLFTLYPEITPQTYTLKIQEVFQDEFNLFGLKVKSAPTSHTPYSVAYSLQDQKHKIVYSGDAAPQSELVTLASDADILISECSFPSGWESNEHLNADSLGIIASQARVKSLIVTHRYPPALNIDLEKQIRLHYKGSIHLALDGYRINL